jgi:hypothetical protein
MPKRGRYFRIIGNAVQVLTIMHHGGKWIDVNERVQLYVARILFRIGFFVLWLTRRLYRAKLLTHADLRHALRAGETLHRLGSRFLRWKRH